MYDLDVDYLFESSKKVLPRSVSMPNPIVTFQPATPKTSNPFYEGIEEGTIARQSPMETDMKLPGFAAEPLQVSPTCLQPKQTSPTFLQPQQTTPTYLQPQQTTPTRLQPQQHSSTCLNTNPFLFDDIGYTTQSSALTSTTHAPVSPALHSPPPSPAVSKSSGVAGVTDVLLQQMTANIELLTNKPVPFLQGSQCVGTNFKPSLDKSLSKFDAFSDFTLFDKTNANLVCNTAFDLLTASDSKGVDKHASNMTNIDFDPIHSDGDKVFSSNLSNEPLFRSDRNSPFLDKGFIKSKSIGHDSLVHRLDQEFADEFTPGYSKSKSVGHDAMVKKLDRSFEDEFTCLARREHSVGLTTPPPQSPRISWADVERQGPNLVKPAHVFCDQGVIFPNRSLTSERNSTVGFVDTPPPNTKTQADNVFAFDDFEEVSFADENQSKNEDHNKKVSDDSDNEDEERPGMPLIPLGSPSNTSIALAERLKITSTNSLENLDAPHGPILRNPALLAASERSFNVSAPNIKQRFIPRPPSAIKPKQLLRIQCDSMMGSLPDLGSSSSAAPEEGYFTGKKSMPPFTRSHSTIPSPAAFSPADDEVNKAFAKPSDALLEHSRYSSTPSDIGSLEGGHTPPAAGRHSKHKFRLTPMEYVDYGPGVVAPVQSSSPERGGKLHDAHKKGKSKFRLTPMEYVDVGPVGFFEFAPSVSGILKHTFGTKKSRHHSFDKLYNSASIQYKDRTDPNWYRRSGDSGNDEPVSSGPQQASPSIRHHWDDICGSAMSSSMPSLNNTNQKFQGADTWTSVELR